MLLQVTVQEGEGLLPEQVPAPQGEMAVPGLLSFTSINKLAGLIISSHSIIAGQIKTLNCSRIR